MRERERESFNVHVHVENNVISRFITLTAFFCFPFFFLQVAVDGVSYHKSCFRCTHGGCVISPSNYVAHEHRLYCKHHHTQLFKQKGNFSQLGNGKNEQVTVVAVAVAVAENAAAE